MAWWQIGVILLVIFLIYTWIAIERSREEDKRFQQWQEEMEADRRRHNAELWVRSIVGEQSLLEQVSEDVFKLNDQTYRNIPIFVSIVEHGILESRGDNTYVANYDALPPAQHENTETVVGRVDYATYIKTSRWKQRREEAKRRAGNRCLVCNSGDRLEVHHRSYANLGNERPEDLTVLCADCHRRFHEGGRMPVR
jgi:5-methylcytosine-specific restriction endonuclease McrA